MSEERLIADGRMLLGDGSYSEGRYVGDTSYEEDAARIAACWNACIGIPTSDLEDGVVVPKAALEWLANGHTGESSRAMCYLLMGADPQGPNWHPGDPGDFGRCLGLLDAVPQWRSQLHEVAELSPFWAAIVSQWDKLERLYRAGDYSGCREVMDAALQPIYDDCLQQNGGADHD